MLTSVQPAAAAIETSNPPLESHEELLELLETYTEAGQWQESVEVLIRFTERESNSTLKAKCLYTAAVICRDELKALDASLDLLNRALDECPDMLKAFDALDRLCTTREDWNTLELNYRKMIKRLPAEGQIELKVRLWRSLAEIYRTRLKDRRSAAACFEVAAELEPDNLQLQEILAELYLLMGPEFATKAIEKHQSLITASPLNIDTYKALRKIYMDLRQQDKAWCLCSALVFLKKADPEEQQFYEQHRPRGFVRSSNRMTDEIWSRYVLHPEEDRTIGAIFASITQVVSKITARPHKQFGLKRKERRDLATDQLHFSKVFNYVTSVLNVARAELYLRPDQPTGLLPAHTTEVPSYVVGQDLLQGRPEKELAFAIAKQLTYLRPEHFLRNALPAPSQLRTVFLTALRMANPNFSIPPADLPEVEKFQKSLASQMHPVLMDQLTMAVRKFASSKSEVNLNKWWTAVELTANRVGFILCNDLETAAKMVSTEPLVMGSPPPKEKVKDLVLFSISEDYFAVRRALGFSI